MNPLFLNTVLLGGDTKAKLAAASEAGFDQIELWTSDVAALDGGAAATRALAATLQIGFTDYQVLLDFDGAPGDKREVKRAEALAMLDTAAEIGIDTVLVPASTDPACDRARIGDDLAWLVDQARLRGRRIAYEGMAWSSVNATFAAAWEAIRGFDPAHAGLVLDSFHLFVRDEDETVIDAVPVDRIFLAQFSDVAHPVALADAKRIARHARLLPGAGKLPLDRLARRLLGRGYVGPIGLEVFNDGLRARDPGPVARMAMDALRRLLGRAEVQPADDNAAGSSR
ncbi:sugar phosphate isomerase/epimerase family protein [Sphingomonas nostoxanthinifaciens]|uniref:sugar phosphate isomerase/epimerase family protein n=1 Tax=Sphingomonas nostoxanthinifaciens TaxID=2872652 RepID=UPI001CC21915|nr:sugar phosphate isomerase/epimerase family protein [Sphingomonas nostoxanthinifaciens]UAK24264.1 sugar phosphate isomerase/epimerase [Sphingomonas nostoxanthinifaciens]